MKLRHLLPALFLASGLHYVTAAEDFSSYKTADEFWKHVEKLKEPPEAQPKSRDEALQMVSEWLGNQQRAAEAFAKAYPALHRHLQPHRAALAARQDQGRFPWELRECAYYEDFEKPKVIYNDITWNPPFSLDCSRELINNTGYFLPTSDSWLLAGMNAPIGWWFA